MATNFKYAASKEEQGVPFLGKVLSADSAGFAIDNLANSQLLTEILKELKIMNLHNAVITDNHFKRTEVEV